MNQDKLLSRDWNEYARALPLRTQAFIGGRYVDAVSDDTFAVTSPIDGKEICRVASCSAEDIDLAVKSARQSYESGGWSRASPRRRKKVMQNFADLILARVDELAAAESLDVGKPIKYSHRMDIPAAANAIAWYGEAVDKIYGELAPVGDRALGMITREPLGVVGCVVPWNFPLLLTSWKIGAALAAGNSVVLKPAEQSPLSALMIAELALQAGIPEGVLNVVPGFGHLAGRALGLHNDVDAIAFTGSTEVGKLFLRYSADSNMKALQLECGGKSPQIVTDDIADLAPVAKAIVQGAFFNQGQVCTAGSRVIVHRNKREELADLVVSHAARMTPANPLDAATDLGCLVDGRQLDRVLDYVATGKSDGAVLRTPGDRVLQETGGYYMRPAVFEKVDPGMRIAREEIFGPVLAFIEYDRPEEAVAMANDSVYGLAASVWSDNLSNAIRIGQQIRAGTVWLNTYDEVDMSTPFGGIKQSGFGRDRSLHALEKYSYLKTTWARI